MKSFRIIQCSDPQLWYADKVGGVFDCFRLERLSAGTVVWTKGDVTPYGKLLNWVWLQDTEEVN